jgi:hypothetical protein
MRKKVSFIALALGLAANSNALTNEEFAAQVQRHEQILTADKKALQEAEKFCTLLSDRRKSEEPRCVAMQKVNSKDLHRGSSIVTSPKRVW